MKQPFEKAIVEITKKVSEVTGIARAPQLPTESANNYPVALTYLGTGKLTAGPIGSRKSLYNVVIDILTKYNNLERDLEILNPFVDLIPQALLEEVSDSGTQFNHTVSTFEYISIQYLSGIRYANVDCRGYRFIMNDLKILVNTENG